MNNYGQLGVGDVDVRHMPKLVSGLQGKQVVHVIVAAGAYHTICTALDGSAFTWGNGDYGKLGLGGDRSNTLVPTLVRGKLQNKAVVQVAAGAQYFMWLATDALVYTWGIDDDGQPGVADVGFASLPVLVQALNISSTA